MRFDQFAHAEPLGIVDWEWKTYQYGRSLAADLRLRPRNAASWVSSAQPRCLARSAGSLPPNRCEQAITPRFQAIGYFGDLFFYGHNWWLGRTLSEART
jgi:hypothetical protein